MLDFWLNEELADKINLEIGKNEVPHSQLITDLYNNGGLFLALSLAKELLDSDPFNHPDFCLCFPVIKITKNTNVSQDLMGSFRSFYKNNEFCSISDWLQSHDSGNKQGIIGVEEINQLHKKLSLKTFAGHNRVCVLWGPELLNIAAANKMLKLLEEPPNKTYFLLISERPDQIIPTILSRLILLRIGMISSEKIKEKLLDESFTNASEVSIAANGSWRAALLLSKNSTLRKKLEFLWIKCLRCAFRSIGNKSIVIELMTLADEISKLTRGEQKSFLLFGSVLVRSALVINYCANETSQYMSLNNFEIKKLAPFINSQNIIEIVKLLDDSHYNLKRNANSKILFSNFVLKISKYLNQKEI